MLLPGWALIQFDTCSYKKKRLEYVERRPCEDREEPAIYKPKRETLKETNPPITLILDFWPQTVTEETWGGGE